jgi:hypothetical protein
MPRLVTLAAALCILAPAAASAAPSAVSAAFGNTLVSTYPDGRTAELWLRPDGRYSAEGRRGDPSSGKWKIKDDKLCLNQSKPFGAPFSYCTPIPAGGMNQSWSAKAVTGEAIQVKLVQGHQSGRR